MTEHPQKNFFFKPAPPGLRWRQVSHQGTKTWVVTFFYWRMSLLPGKRVRGFNPCSTHVWNIFHSTNHLGPRCSHHYHSHHHNQIILMIIIARAVFVIFVCVTGNKSDPSIWFPSVWKRLEEGRKIYLSSPCGGPECNLTKHPRHPKATVTLSYPPSEP